LVLETSPSRDTPSHSSLAWLFLEELIRAAAEGHLGQRPDTVIAMLQARIGQLSAGPRRAVLAAAVFGQTLWQGGVARLLGHAEVSLEVEGWFQTLLVAEIIESHGSSRIPEQKEYGFRHALVRDAAYALLTPADLKVGHQLAAEFLEFRAQGTPEAGLDRDDHAAALVGSGNSGRFRSGNSGRF
jgi:predicted ATPase